MKEGEQPAGALAARLSRELSDLERESRYRSLTSSRGIDFTSNDYLGLASHPQLRTQAIDALQCDLDLSSSGSRLLSGNHSAHETLEREFASFVKSESALFFNSGYDANFALLTTLPTRHDVIIYDSLVHASLKEGAHASFANKRSFEHNSVSALRALLNDSRHSGDRYVVVESVYSMDGDESPLQEIASLCRDANAILIVDEAHATGVFGDGGRGLIDELGIRDKVCASVHTCGKALGAAGALVASSRVVIDYLINKARPFIYTTALPPLIAQQARNALHLLETDHSLIEGLHSNVALARKLLSRSLERWQMIAGRSPIIAIVIGDDAECFEAAQLLQQEGMEIRAVRPPTVPHGTSRLRIAIHATHSSEELQLLATTLKMVEQQCATHYAIQTYES